MDAPAHAAQASVSALPASQRQARGSFGRFLHAWVLFSLCGGGRTVVVLLTQGAPLPSENRATPSASSFARRCHDSHCEDRFFFFF